MNQLLNRLAEVKQSLTGKEVSQDELVYQKNANEVEHTTNTGFGKELVPVDVLSDSVYNAVPQYSSFLSMLPGFHGNNMGVSEKVAIKGEIGLAQGNSEWTTGAGIIAQGRNRLATGEVTINQAPMILSVDISKRLVNHSVADVEAFVRDEITRQFARTAESMIVNCDSSNLTTGNVNCDDATPTDTFTAGANDHRLLLDNGARKIALGGTVNVDYKDVGSLDFDDFLNVRAMLDEYSTDLNNLLLLMNGATWNKALTIADFKEMYKNGAFSTITTGSLMGKVAGVDCIVNRDFRLTKANGKQSATGGNNTKGGFLYMYKPAIQWGFGQPIETDVVKIPGKGYSVIATIEFGFAIVSKKAGITSPSIALGINATV